MKKNIKIKLGKTSKGKKFIIHQFDADEKVIETIQCEIIGTDNSYKEYLFLIPEDVRGFTISNFHIIHYDVNKKYIGKKFNTVSF